MKFSVPDMSCGHCVAAIEKAVQAKDAAASIACNLDNRTVEIASALSAATVQTAIREAGYELTAL